MTRKLSILKRKFYGGISNDLKKFGVIVKRHPKNQELYTMIDYRTDKTISHNGKDFVNIDVLEEYADFWSSVI